MLLFKEFAGDFFYENKWKILAYLLVIIIFFPLEVVALPKIYGIMFDKIKLATQKGDLFTNVLKNIKEMNLLGSMFILLVTWLLIILAYGGKHHMESELIPGFMSFIRKKLFDKTMNAFKEDYSDVKTGVYLSRMLELMRCAKDLFHYFINSLFPYFMAIVFTVLYLFINNKTIGSVLIISQLIVLTILWFGGYHIMEKVKDRENYMNEHVNQGIQNSIDNLMNIYINNEAENEVKKNNKNEREGERQMSDIMFWQNNVITGCDTLVLVAYGISIILIYKMLQKKQIKTADAIVYVLVLGKFLEFSMEFISGSIHQISFKYGIVKAAEPYLSQILNENKERVKTSGITKGNIKFKDIVFRYEKDSKELLFDGLNLEINGGESTAIMGRSGSGKTTLMKMLVGLYKPEKGKITIDGININTLNLEYLRDNVNYVNQTTKLFEDSVLFNMKYGNDVKESDIIAKLKKYQLDEVFSDLPNGVKGNAGLNGGNLSGGMQKVTILMRGLLKKGKIIILDEPLAGLDEKTINKVIRFILQETSGKTLLIITHDKAIIPHLNNVVDINDLQ
tara:strand:+ start:54604 stop:56295 length:1692 start_codon:yes stop_codon:yes gene_type:complete